MRRSIIQTMSNQDRYDSAFLGILQNEGQIQEFLDVFFSFLYRRTDFFRHLITPTDKYGFRPGVAKKLVLNAFKKYESLAAEKNRKLKEAYEKFLEEEKTRMDAEACHVVAREEIVAEAPTRPEFEMTVETTTETTSSEGAQETYDTVTCDNVMESSDKDEGTKHVSLETSRDVPVPNSDDAVENNRLLEAPQATDSIPLPVDTASDRHSRGGDGAVCDDALVKVQSSTAKDVNEKKKSGGSDDDDDDSELARAQRLYQANPESYNGAIRENYSWSQSITDLDVRVKVPGFVKSSKKMGVSVKVDRKHLRVTYKDLMGSEVVVVDGDLCWDVHRDESTWSLVPGEQVHINMEKVQERWWDALLEGEPKISTRKIDPSRPITDLGDEEQAKIAEMMYNERQKRLGLPQSHEMKTHELLKKAWDAEGSPFKGQPFDPAKLNISTGGF